MRRQSRSTENNVRGAYRKRIEDKMAMAGPAMSERYRQQLDQLDEGGPVVVRGWQVSRLLPDKPANSAHRWYRLDPDGSATEVEPVWQGRDIVGWEVADGAA